MHLYLYVLSQISGIDCMLPCENGGICVERTCQCLPDFTGKYCTIKSKSYVSGVKILRFRMCSKRFVYLCQSVQDIKTAYSNFRNV